MRKITFSISTINQTYTEVSVTVPIMSIYK